MKKRKIKKEKVKIKVKVKIYIISDGEYLKIGISTHPNKRLKQMQTSNARELRVVRSYQIGSRKTAEGWEAYIHKVMAEYHVRGEWFNAPLERTIKYLNRLLINRATRYAPK